MKELTTKTNSNKILESFRACEPNDEVNLKTKKGYIYETGGILSKLVGKQQYFAIGGKWVKV